MIQINALTKEYGTLKAVDNLDLNVLKGEVFGFLGPNGAGKTTTIRVMAGLIPPTMGSISIGGYDVVAHPREAKKVTGFIPDTPYLFEKLTGHEFLRFAGRLYGMNGTRVESESERLLAFFDLTEWADQLVESYSHGMKKRLAMASALLHDPRVIIVDEPMVGLDPLGAKKVRGLFRDLANEGKTIFLTTHELPTAEAVCDRIGIIHHGKLIGLGNMDELSTQARIPGSHLEEVFLRLTLETSLGIS